MRYQSPPPPPLGRQLAEWRRPLDDNPTVDEAMVRMLRAVERHLRPDRPRPEDNGLSPVAAD
jgi:hypothetical protein